MEIRSYDPIQEPRHEEVRGDKTEEKFASRWFRHILARFGKPVVVDRRPLQEAGTVEILFGLARRHSEPYSVVVAEAQRSAAHAVHSKRAFERAVDRAVRDAVRRSDWVVSNGAGRYVIHCPHTAKAGALQFAERVRKCVGMVPDCQAITGQANFPDDALTLEEVVNIASKAAERGRRALAGGRGGGEGTDLNPSTRSRGESSGTTSNRLKRTLDLVLVIGAAPLYLPIIGSIALAQLCSDPKAPVFFRQERTGRAGRRFTMYKFRTMVPEAEELKQQVAHLNELSWPDFKISDDPRITRLGRVLRRTSLDELPQLFNVIRGDMSLVGPRPTSFAPDRYKLWHTERLDVIPGMTGLWQVERTRATEFDERLRLDIAYIRTRRPWTDAILLARTFWMVTIGRGSS